MNEAAARHRNRTRRRKLSQPNVEKELTVGWPSSVPGRKPAVLRLEPPLSPRTG